MGAFLVPYLVKDYKQAYAMFNGKVGDRLDKEFQDKYKLKLSVLLRLRLPPFLDQQERHRRAEGPARGKKIRVQQAKVFSDTINGLGGNAVPMAWGEVVSAAKQGVIDGGDLPIANIDLLKIYEVSKFCLADVSQLRSVLRDDESRLLGGSLRRAQEAHARRRSRDPGEVRNNIEPVDSFEKAKALLEPRGMTVVQGNVEAVPQDRAGERSGPPTRRNTARCGTRSKASSPDCHFGAEADLSAPAPFRSSSSSPLPRFNRTMMRALAAVPKLAVTALIVLAIINLLIGVILRYFVGAITDYFDIDPVPFTWVEEVGEMSLAWMTMIGAAIGVRQRAHFTLQVVVHRLSAATQLWISRFNHLLSSAWAVSPPGTATSCACSTAC